MIRAQPAGGGVVLVKESDEGNERTNERDLIVSAEPSLTIPVTVCTRTRTRLATVFEEAAARGSRSQY